MTTPETTLEHLFGGRTAVVIDDAITATLARDTRARLAGYTRYALVDRGSYDVIASPALDPGLLAALIARAERATGRSLALAESRALRLGPGDYLLAHHDRMHDGHPVELVLDVSPAGVPGAEVHYRRRGQVYFRVPSSPATLAIVERGPTVACNHTYVSKRHAGAEIVRLLLLLHDRA